MRDVDRRILGMARRQHGLIRRRQALALGLTPDAIRHRTGTGAWAPVYRSVYRMAAVEITWHQRVLAACFAADGLASHRTAAVLWGLGSVRPGRPEITIPRQRRIKTPDIRVHQSTQAESFGRRVVDSIPTTGVARTLVDLGAVVRVDQVEEAVDDARRRRLVDWIELHDALVRHARRGRDGVGAFRAVLEERYGDSAVPDSVFNRRVQRLLVDHGLPPPLMEHEIHTADGAFVARLDLAYPERLVADVRAAHRQAKLRPGAAL